MKELLLEYNAKEQQLLKNMTKKSLKEKILLVQSF